MTDKEDDDGYMTEEQFYSFIDKMVNEYKLQPEDISGITGASRPTIARWIAHTGRPHRFSRAGMIHLLQKWIDKQ